MTGRILFLSLFAASGMLFAQPRITRLVNSASYIPPPLPGSGIAQGSIFVVFGSGLGPAQLVQASGYPIPDTLSGVSIRVSGGGQEVNCPMVYVSAGQTAAILPSRTPPGNALARITVNGQTSEPIALNVVRNGIGLYTLNSAGIGPAVLTDANFGVITRTNAAVEGQPVIAWGTGVGAANVPDNESPPAFDPPVTVEVFVGGKLANVRYRGRAPGFAGLDQIVFDIPEGVRGCNVSLVMRAGTNTSNFASIPVAGSSRVCSDTNGLGEEDLSAIPAGGLRVGAVSLTRGVVRLTLPVLGTLDTISDIGGGSFQRIDLNGIQRGALQAGGPGGGVSIGNCTVYTFQGEGPGADPIPVTGLDAGPSLTITGPGGNKTVPSQSLGQYFAQLGTGTSTGTPLPGATSPPYLAAGDYTITAPGGRDVGAFTARVRIPAVFNWTNRDAIERINRGQELPISWSGGNPSAEYIYILGASQRRNPNVGAGFLCTAPASAGSFTVPAIVTSSLPPSENAQGVATGSLTVANVPLPNSNRFTAQGLDVGLIQYGTTIIKLLPVE